MLLLRSPGQPIPLCWLLTTDGKIGSDLFGNWNNADFTEYLLESGADPNDADGKGCTLPMIAAIRDGRLELVELLVEAGADLNGRNNWSDGGFQPVIHCAAQSQSERILQYLIDRGADVTVTDHLGRTAADYACSTANLRILEEAGCVPTEKTT